MKIKISLDHWTVQKAQASAVRMDVFVIEQKIPKELEWDEMDEHCIHAVATDTSGLAVGTGRLLPDGRIGRMAVLASARGSGVGGMLLQSLMQVARERGDRRVILSAQRPAEKFYVQHGFKLVGEEYLEAGIWHIDMEYGFE
jgi:predicted GNAT family N-acyltransferase